MPVENTFIRIQDVLDPSIEAKVEDFLEQHPYLRAGLDDELLAHLKRWLGEEMTISSHGRQNGNMG